MAIDMHAHFLPPALPDMLRARQYLPRIERLPDGKELFHRPFGTTPFNPSYVDIEQRVAVLDSLNIETQLLSLPGLIGIDSLPVAESRPMVMTFNDSLAGVLQRFPGRFAGLAGLPMADIGAAPLCHASRFRRRNTADQLLFVGRRSAQAGAAVRDW